ncbi:MAG: hypothetical protein JW888_06535 [Pirellulales bacterium]|nr:hypothetical protein [Pirellulales bacterium]
MDVSTDTVDFDWIALAHEHWVALVLIGVFLLAGWALVVVIRGRRRTSPRSSDDYAIDVSVLPDLPRPPGPPVLEFFHLPVRLAAIVLAPVGRASELPARESLPEVIDSIVPGLDQVAAAHEPLIRAWPRQVSSRGFANAFFQNVRLPGDHGKKTVWSSVAGVFRVGDEPMMAGLVLRAETANRHGNYVMANEDEWLGILRVRLS